VRRLWDVVRIVRCAVSKIQTATDMERSRGLDNDSIMSSAGVVWAACIASSKKRIRTGCTALNGQKLPKRQSSDRPRGSISGVDTKSRPNKAGFSRRYRLRLKPTKSQAPCKTWKNGERATEETVNIMSVRCRGPGGDINSPWRLRTW